MSHYTCSQRLGQSWAQPLPQYKPAPAAYHCNIYRDAETGRERWGHAMGVDVDTDNPCPTGLGADIDVTIQPTKKPGAVRVWQSRGFYLKPD